MTTVVHTQVSNLELIILTCIITTDQLPQPCCDTIIATMIDTIHNFFRLAT